MAKGLLDDQEISVPCPQCGQQFKGQIGRLRAKRGFDCRPCKAWVDVDMKQFDQQVRAVERQLKSLGFG